MVLPKRPMSNRPVPAGRRLEQGVSKKSKWAGTDPNAARDEARRLAELDRSRDKLGNLVDVYVKLLTDKTLPKKRSVKQQERQREVLDALPFAAAELDVRNILLPDVSGLR